MYLMKFCDRVISLSMAWTCSCLDGMGAVGARLLYLLAIGARAIVWVPGVLDDVSDDLWAFARRRVYRRHDADDARQKEDHEHKHGRDVGSGVVRVRVVRGDDLEQEEEREHRPTVVCVYIRARCTQHVMTAGIMMMAMRSRVHIGMTRGCPYISGMCCVIIKAYYVKAQVY